MRTGFTTPPKLTSKSIFQFGIKPAWALNYLFREKFELSQLSSHVNEGTNISISAEIILPICWIKEKAKARACLKGIEEKLKPMQL